MPYTGRSNFIGNLMKNSELAEKTRQNYADRAAFLRRETKKGLFFILKNPDTYIKWIHGRYPNVETAKTYISLILAIFKHNPGLPEQLSTAHAAWTAEFKCINEQIDQRINDNRPSERQQEAFVSYEELCKKRDELEPGSIDRLLLGFFTHIPPSRADLGATALYYTRSIPPESARAANYILNNRILVLTKFKTSKFYSKIEKPLPEPLVADLEKSLMKEPRKWLFVGKNGEPYMKNNTFTKWTTGRFLKLFGRPLSITTIRHSYISSLDFNSLSENEKRHIAQQMMHSVATQGKYRFIFGGAGAD